MYSAQNIRIYLICSDHVLKAMKPFLAKHGINTFYHAAGMKDPYAERAIGLVKEGLRAHILGLPYNLPRALYPFAINDVAKCRNAFPNPVNLQHTTAQEAFSGDKPNFNNFMASPFGQIVLTKNVEVKRKIDQPAAKHAIIVGRPFGQSQQVQVWIVVDESMKVVTRQTIYPIPMTEIIRDLINSIAARHAAVPPIGDTLDLIRTTEDTSKLSLLPIPTSIPIPAPLPRDGSTVVHA